MKRDIAEIMSTLTALDNYSQEAVRAIAIAIYCAYNEDESASVRSIIGEYGLEVLEREIEQHFE